MSEQLDIEAWRNDHIPYRLELLDGLAWWCEWCELKEVGRNDRTLDVLVNSFTINPRTLTNRIVESGLMGGRFLVDFLGLTADRDGASPPKYTLAQKKKAAADDISLERFGMHKVKLDQVGSAADQEACAYLCGVASGGVAHPRDRGKNVHFSQLRRAAGLIRRLTIESFYDGKAPAGIECELRQIFDLGSPAPY